MTVLGIDPHITKQYGYAVLKDGKLICSGEAVLIEIYDLMVNYSPDLVAIEDQYMALNYNTAKKLSWSAGKVMGLAQFRGIRFEDVNVATWKAKMKARDGGHIDRVLELFDYVATDDEASAILIAAYSEEYLKEPKKVVPKKRKKKKNITVGVKVTKCKGNTVLVASEVFESARSICYSCSKVSECPIRIPVGGKCPCLQQNN